MPKKVVCSLGLQHYEGSSSTLQVFDLDFYALLDPEVTLSFITPFIEVKFDVNLETLSEPFSVSSLVGDQVIPRWIYRNFPVMVSQKVTLVDLENFEMVDFNVILCIDWLNSYHALVNCRTRIVRLQLLGEPIL